MGRCRKLLLLLFCSLQLIGQKSIQKTDSIKSKVLKEVVVSGRKIAEMGGSMVLIHKQFKAIPSFVGEKDFVKSLTFLPGIKTDGEASSNFYVRGGSYDQNLYLMDNIPVFGGSHFAGMFSTFNSEAIQSVEIVKSGFLANYGGRLSSILNIQQRNSMDSSNLDLGVGILFSKIYLNKVIIPQKWSIMVAARRSYLDLFYKPPKDNFSIPSMNYLDFNLKSTFQYNQNNQFNFILFGNAESVFTKEIDTTVLNSEHFKGVISSLSAGINWLKTYKGHSMEFTLYNSKSNISYRDFITTNKDIQKTFWGNGISEVGLKATDSFKYKNLTIKAGFNFINYQLVPGSFTFQQFGIDKNEVNLQYDKINAQVLSGFTSGQFRVKDRTLIDLGIRFNLAKSKMNQDFSIEPRLNLLHELSKNTKLRFSFTKMNQFLHLLINPSMGLGFDTWLPFTKSFPKEQSYQLNTGIDFQLFKNRYMLTVDLYHKQFKDIIYYKDGFGQNDVYSEAFIRNGFESIIDKGSGSARGFEILFQKNKGRFTGFISYDYSWVQYQFDQVNGGIPFFPRFDKRHNFSFVGSVQISKLWTFNASWVYQSGQPFPTPDYMFGIPSYDYSNGTFDLDYSAKLGINQGARDNFRTKAFHRLNVSFMRQIRKKYATITWEFGAYNAYNQKNPYLYLFQKNNGRYNVFSYQVFPILPTISYRVSF